MNFQELIAHFHSQANAARAIGTSNQVVSAWKRNGIPLGRQFEIQVLTGGRLKADGVHRTPWSKRTTEVKTDDSIA